LLINVVGLTFFAFLAVVLSVVVPASSNIVGGISDQWLFLAVGYYAVFSWAAGLRERDHPTFALTWGSPAFLTVIFGYGMVAFMAYAASYWGAPYAERTFADRPEMLFGWLEVGATKTDLGWWLGAPGAVAGFLGVIFGGRMADRLLEKRKDGRIWVVLFGLLAPIPPVVVAYTADDLITFYAFSFLECAGLRRPHFSSPPHWLVWALGHLWRVMYRQRTVMTSVLERAEAAGESTLSFS